ncbi:MAG: MliC family protein [Halioglobus sp.]
MWINLHRRLKLKAAMLTCTSALFAIAAICHATEPGFDCAKADGQVQQLVCSDDQLAALDLRLTEVYLTALKNLPHENLALLKSEQRGWIKSRDECWKSDNVSDCVTLEYRTRIVQLQIQSGQLTAPTAVSFACSRTEKVPLFATFYNDTAPPAVVLTRGNDQVIAFVDRSGSGARYTAYGVEFWEHQGEATINWFGTELVCSVMK